MRFSDKVYKQMTEAVEVEAYLLGFRPFPSECSDQTLWAKSAKQAENIKVGNSIYHFLPPKLKRKLDLARKAYCKLAEQE